MEEKSNDPISNILLVGSDVGKLCKYSSVGKSTKPSDDKSMVIILADLVQHLWCVSKSLVIHLETCIRHKKRLNEKKYPVELCTGHITKYTHFSEITGITKDNQCRIVNDTDDTMVGSIQA
jgi:hypothetical protein